LKKEIDVKVQLHTSVFRANEIIEDLKKNHPQIKIIAISGGGGIKKADCLKLAESIGADRILEKPIERKDLLFEVHALLSQHQTRHKEV